MKMNSTPNATARSLLSIEAGIDQIFHALSESEKTRILSLITSLDAIITSTPLVTDRIRICAITMLYIKTMQAMRGSSTKTSNIIDPSTGENITQ